MNPFVRADSPQHRCQQQTESGDTEDQQVHLSRETQVKDMERVALFPSVRTNADQVLKYLHCDTNSGNACALIHH